MSCTGCGGAGRLRCCPSQAWPLVLTLLGVAQFAWGLEFAGQRAVLRHSILVTQLPVGTEAERLGPQAGSMLRASYGEGARIVRLDPDGTLHVLTPGFHSACEPDVSFDGKRFLFAGKRTPQEPWNIYEMAIDGSGVRQITRGLGDCRYPGYLSTQYVITATEPWYQITFVCTGQGWVNEAGGGPAAALYSCRLDGSEVKRLTYNLSSDYDPVIMWDGRLLYASWQRASLEHGLRGRIRIFGINTDGSDYAAYVAPVGRQIQHMPCTTPTGLAVFVQCDRALWDGAGTLAAVETRRPLKTYRPLTAEADGLFHSPAPLPDGRLLVAWRPADGTRSHGLYCLDLTWRRAALVFDDPAFHDFHAKAVFRRDEPDGRSSVVDESVPHGVLYCLNVYLSDLNAKQQPWVRPGVPLRVRVVEGMARTKAASPGTREAAAPEPPWPALAPRRVLGEVPIQKDGSFVLEVPANTPLELQILDETGMSLRRCGWIWARSRFNQGCIGCHEDPELSPENVMTDALRRWAMRGGAYADEDIEAQRKKSGGAPAGPRRELSSRPGAARPAVDFRRDLVPVIAAKCAGCHDPQGSPPRLELPQAASAEAADAAARRVYTALMAREGSPAENPWGKYVHPGRARTSPLVWHLVGRNTSRPWDQPWPQRPVKPIEPGRLPPLTDAERQRFIEWIDLGAPWEVSFQ